MPMAKTVLIATWVTREKADALSLCAVYLGASRAEVLTQQIDEVIKECPLPDKMIQDIAKKLFLAWFYEPLTLKKTKKISWAEYVSETRRKLAKRLSPELIDSVVAAMHTHAKEEACSGKKDQ